MGERRKVKVWWDSESDFLSVTFDGKDGYMVETEDDRVMAKVNEHGDIVGFHILGVSTVKNKPLEVDMKVPEPESTS